MYVHTSDLKKFNCEFLFYTTSYLLQLKGKIVAPPQKAFKDKSSWIRIQYVNSLTIDGTSTGRIDGFGSTWWPCKSCRRPIVQDYYNIIHFNFFNLYLYFSK